MNSMPFCSSLERRPPVSVIWVQESEEGKCGRRVFAYLKSVVRVVPWPLPVLAAREMRSSATNAAVSRNAMQRVQKQHAPGLPIRRRRSQKPTSSSAEKAARAAPDAVNMPAACKATGDNTFRAARRGVGLRRERVRPGMAGSMNRAPRPCVATGCEFFASFAVLNPRQGVAINREW